MDDWCTEEEDLSREFRKLRRNHNTSGFYEGFDIGKEQTVQQGFNEGFAAFGNLFFSIGQLLGTLEALLHHSLSNPNQKLDITIKKLKSDVEDLKNKIVSDINSKADEEEEGCCGGSNNGGCCKKIPLDQTKIAEEINELRDSTNAALKEIFNSSVSISNQDNPFTAL